MQEATANKAVRVKRLRPGDDVLTYCGRCKAERTHQIVAMNADGVPATVICRMCGGQHKYRAKIASDGIASTAERKPAVRKSGAPPPAFVPAKAARPYSPREVYGEGDPVDHPTFGAGMVIGARAGKIEVRFGDATKLLIHAG